MGGPKVIFYGRPKSHISWEAHFKLLGGPFELLRGGHYKFMGGPNLLLGGPFPEAPKILKGGPFLFLGDPLI